MFCNATEPGNSISSPTTNPSEGATSLTPVSTDGNSTAPEPVSQTTAEEIESFPSVTSDKYDTLSAPKPIPSSVGSAKRRRGRPPLHSHQAVERRHQKLIDVRTSLHFASFILYYINATSCYHTKSELQ